MTAGVTPPSTFTAAKPTCSKCGTLKTGKRSCCARGGAWFENCGNVGDDDFEYTWYEGIQACKGATNSIPGKAQSESVLYDTNTTQLPIPFDKSIVVSVTGRMHSVDAISNSRGYEGRTILDVFTGIFLASVHIVVHANIISSF